MRNKKEKEIGNMCEGGISTKRVWKCYIKEWPWRLTERKWLRHCIFWEKEHSKKKHDLGGITRPGVSKEQQGHKTGEVEREGQEW